MSGMARRIASLVAWAARRRARWTTRAAIITPCSTTTSTAPRMYQPDLGAGRDARFRNVPALQLRCFRDHRADLCRIQHRATLLARVPDVEHHAARLHRANGRQQPIDGG